MEEKKTRQKWPSILRWTLWVILVQIVLINISAAFYAYRLTHFYNDPSLRTSQPSGNIFTKTWKLFTGPKFPKSQINDVPVFIYDTVSLQTENQLIFEDNFLWTVRIHFFKTKTLLGWLYIVGLTTIKVVNLLLKFR